MLLSSDTYCKAFLCSSVLERFTYKKIVWGKKHICVCLRWGWDDKTRARVQRPNGAFAWRSRGEGAGGLEASIQRYLSKASGQKKRGEWKMCLPLSSLLGVVYSCLS
jgi:hypothetical protein